MKQLLLLIAFINAANVCISQKSKKPFIDHMTFSLLIGGDDFVVDKNKRQEQWRDQRTVPYTIDSLVHFSGPVAHYANVLPREAGIRFQVSKDLLKTSSHRLLHRKLLLSAGIGYRNVKYRNDEFYGGDSRAFQDTTKVYMNESLVFGQKKNLLELNQSIVYRFNSFLCKRLEYFIGIGSMVRYEMNNTVTEYYKKERSSYNTITRRFETQIVQQTNERIPAKTQTRFLLNVPFGFNYRLSRTSDLLLEFGYSYSRNRYTNVNKKNEAWTANFGYTYTFSD